MKQIILLEESEIRRLNKGKQLEITTPTGPLVIGFDKQSRNGVADESGPTSTEAFCKKCNRTFKNVRGLRLHKTLKHGV